MIFETHVAQSIVGHVGKLRLACGQRLSQYTDVGVLCIDYQVFNRFAQLAMFFLARDDLRARYLELVALASHSLN